MVHADYFTHHFLIAMPSMGDTRFERTVIYVCEHTDKGALGLVINKPMEVAFADLLTHLGFLGKHSQGFTLSQPILWGGPCARDRGFVLHRSLGLWKNSFAISEEVTLTTSQDILESMGQGNGPEAALIAFGCSRWAAGQLERELADNVWLTVPAADHILFDCSFKDRWSSAATTIGIDFNCMAYHAGHA